MRFTELRSAETIAALVQEIGFLPFFTNEFSGDGQGTSVWNGSRILPTIDETALCCQKS